MLELKHLRTKDAGFVEAVYSATHSTPGRGGTCLKLDVTLTTNTRMGKTFVTAELNPQLDTLDPNAAFDKLAEWAERLALTLRNRGPATPAAYVFE
jgi:hypothetical protein